MKIKNKIKNTALSLGTITSIVSPVIVVISCGNKEKIRKFNILPTYTGQADQLIALGVHSDYYPTQLNQKKPYKYLTDPGQYMTQQDDLFKEKFAKAIDGLLPKVIGPSWWNQDAKDSDDSRIDNTYWQKQQGNIVLYEHYLLDDDQKIIESSWAPKHNAETAIQTNFRASRDPYTRIPKGVFYGWDLSQATIDKIIRDEVLTKDDFTEIGPDGLTDPKTPKSLSGIELSGSQKELDITLNNDTEIITKKDAQIIKNLREKRKEFIDNTDGKNESDWFYNDWFFVDFFHRNYLDNKQFQNSDFKNWIIDSETQGGKTGTENVFGGDADQSKQIKNLFDAATYKAVEVQNGIGPSSYTSQHHPIYEQQGGEIGAAPMFEGSLRDNQLYLYNVASQISNLAKYGTPYGKQNFDALPIGSKTDIVDSTSYNELAKTQYQANQIKNWVSQNVSPTQLNELKGAYNKANKITGQLYSRMAAMKKYFEDLGLNDKTFGIVTIAPGGGVSTIQGMSKFSFVYKELGFAQPIPTNLATLSTGASTFIKNWKNGENSYLNSEGVVESSVSKDIKDAVGPDAIFNMDDNGWFWNISKPASGEEHDLSPDKLELFKGTFDLGIVAARDVNYDAEIDKNSGIKEKLGKLFKDSNNANKTIKNARNGINYDLWNEGLKTPFVLHMLLDQIMTKAQVYVETNGTAIQKDKIKNSNNLKDAKFWGDYFTHEFV